MLRSLRNKSQSVFFKIFLGLLVIGFAAWGVGDLTGGSKGKSVLSVENKKISLEEVLNEINRARYMLPERPSMEEVIKNGMHINILNRFEQEVLINQEASYLNLTVPLSEQMKLIQKEKAFKDPLGKFSQSKFIQSLKNIGLSETEYLDKIKTETNFRQLLMPFMSNDFYSERIIKKVMDWQNQIRDIEYEIFDFVNENEIKKPSNQTLKTFYEKNKKSLEIPKTRDIKFIKIKPSYFEHQVQINQELLDEKYEIEKSNYITEETREIVQITTQDLKNANDFIELIKNGKNFDETAKNKFNLTPSDTNIGYVKKSDLPKESAELIFKAKLNEILGPIKTKFGLTIYKIKNISPEKQIGYEKVIENVKKKLIKEKSIEILFEKLDLIEDSIAEGSTLQEITSSKIFDNKIIIEELDKISEQGLVYSYDKNTNSLNKNKEFLKNIWNTNINELSDLIEANDDNFYLIEVVNENKKESPIYELVKVKIYKQWLKNEIIIKTKEKAKNLVIANQNNLISKKSIKRNDKTLDKLNDPYIISRIFELNANKVKFLELQDNILAIKINEVRTENYKFNKENYNQLNISFSKSFFNDFSNLYIQNLATKHKLKRNYEEIENYIHNSD